MDDNNNNEQTRYESMDKASMIELIKSEKKEKSFVKKKLEDLKNLNTEMSKQ